VERKLRKDLSMRFRAAALTVAILCTFSPATAEPTEQEFVDYVASTSSFLEQCAVRQVIDTEGVQEEVGEMAYALGLYDGDFWPATQKGAAGVVYDMLAEKWIQLEIDRKACLFVLGEQKKIRISLSRYF
jgi:hypothetical protein